jgi:hypothetical protein
MAYDIYTITEKYRSKRGRAQGSVNFKKLILPILRIALEGVKERSKIYSLLNKRMNFNDADLSPHQTSNDEGLQSTRYKEFEYTGLWSIWHLRKNGYIKDLSRGRFELTNKGEEFIQENKLGESDDINPDAEVKIINKIIAGTKKIIEEEAAQIEEEEPEEIILAEGNTEEKFEEYRMNRRIEFITFHPSYSYEEFVEGVTFNPDRQAGQSEYYIKDGIFKTLCKRAMSSAIRNYNMSLEEPNSELQEFEKIDQKRYFERLLVAIKKSGIKKKELFRNAPRFVLIIDEINRGDISKIFGELITLIEDDKRLGGSFEIVVKLPYSNDSFFVPPNLFIIGTMNTADRSIALLDIALRRRFTFYPYMPQLGEESDLYKNKKKKLDEDSFSKFDRFRKAVKAINKVLVNIPDIGRDRQIGHSYLFGLGTSKDIDRDISVLWNSKLLPLIEEYCYSDSTYLKDILNIPEASYLKEITENSEIYDFENA